jgi:pimeloyl-ACP methyl ester carboxylesterase
MSETIVLIHGLWMTPRSWDSWKKRFEDQGHTVLAPAWPGMDRSVAEINDDPSVLKAYGMAELIDHYDRIINGLDAKPIIMGHSMGGAVTQVLANRGLGKAAVGVAPATVKGIPDLPFSTIRSSRSVLGNPFNSDKATPLNKKQFHYAFGNTMNEAESDRLYEEQAVPAVNNVLFDVAFANFHKHPPTEVDFESSERPPLLMIGFEHDHVVPPKVVWHNSVKYHNAPAVTVFHEFPDRPHYPGAAGWEDVADFALSWALDPTREIEDSDVF